jgi:hypothetical protein
MVCWAAAVVLLAATARPAAAWHNRGHMTVALIAYRQLDDGQKKKVQQILKKHPHFEEFLSANRPDDAPLDEWVVMQAAVWPDWVRSNHTEEYHKPFHHYVNLPIKRLDGATEEQVNEIEKNVKALPDDESSGVLLKELPKRLKELKDETTKAEDRAVALCWILHLIGDIHQPLHAATLFTKNSRKGDRGGNAAFVPWKGRVENLHAIWDGIVGWDEFSGSLMTPYAVVDMMARGLAKRHSVTAKEREVTKIDDWATESRDLAEKEAYSFDGKPLKIVFNFDTHHHHLHVSDLTRLPNGYAKRARGVAEKRVVLAGFRLGDRLKDTLP